jgi:hypothetical protein
MRTDAYIQGTLDGLDRDLDTVPRVQRVLQYSCSTQAVQTSKSEWVTSQQECVTKAGADRDLDTPSFDSGIMQYTCSTHAAQ